ncbi:MAG: tetratricopeptide repeat protein [Endomicrobium sp.]|jgi:tetratricopeptide (TPR) repeat protein|nr:tetratricopeptide repeat protein [Endomicrobium sp.]
MINVIQRNLSIKIFAVVLLLIFFIFLLIFSRKDIKGNNRAVKYFNKGNFEAAYKNFNKELERLSGSCSILNNAAGTEYKLDILDEAQIKYNTVLQSLCPNKNEKFTALYSLGNIEYKNNNFQKAVDLYKEALKLNPKDKDAKYNLEAALLKLNEQNNQKSSQDQNKNQDKNNKQDNQQKNQDDQNNEQDKRNNNSDKNKDSANQKEQSEQKQSKHSEIKGQEEKENKKNTDYTMFLNYYNETDKNSNKLRNKNKKALLSQPQEDW